MMKLYGCIADEHDLRLVLVAVLVALLGCNTIVSLLRRADLASGNRQRFMLGTLAVAGGSTIWATHFIAMLGFTPRIGMQFDFVDTTLSLILAIFCTGVGSWLAVLRPTFTSRAGGGSVIGLGIAAMHYTGVMAIKVPGVMLWDNTWLAISVAFAVGLGGCGTVLALLSGKSVGLRHVAVGTLCMAICSLHFTGMAALTFELGGAAQLDTAPPWILAANLAIIVNVVVLLSVATLRKDRRVARQLREQRATLRELADVSVEGLLVCDGSVISTGNSSFLALTGFELEALRRMNLNILFDGWSFGDDYLGSSTTERILVSASGERIPVELVRKRATFFGAPREIVAVRDLRERRRAEEEIRFLAHHDALTGLSNRTSFTASLTNQIRNQPESSQQCVAVLALDLDRFKEVNDSLGHAVGDLLLKRVAGRLRAVVRDTDCIARLGGDEFAITVTACATPDKACALSARLVEVVRRPYILNGKIVNIGVSIGIALTPVDGADTAALLKKADMALYRAKADGRNTYRRYEHSMEELLQRKRTLELDLRRALILGHLEVRYQPLFDVRTQSVRGFEALVRWQHPDHGMIPPLDFIPLAEETGLIIPLGEMVLNAATQQATIWGNHITVAVNLSAAQFTGGGLVNTVRSALERSGLPACRLELEITESVLMCDGPEMLKTLHHLRDLGVRISMDDFGTGYSSLSYLRSFPFDRIKIDKSFVQEMIRSSESAAIISAVVTIGQRLGIAITVEGVETADQMARIQAEGVDTVQGFFIGPPVTGSETCGFLDLGALEAA